FRTSPAIGQGNANEIIRLRQYTFPCLPRLPDPGGTPPDALLGRRVLPKLPRVAPVPFGPTLPRRPGPGRRGRLGPLLLGGAGPQVERPEPTGHPSVHPLARQADVPQTAPVYRSGNLRKECGGRDTTCPATPPGRDEAAPGQERG